jgi:hypothetical protein
MVVSGQTPAAGEGFLRLTTGVVGHHSEEEEARKKAGGEFAEIYEDLEQRYKHRLANLTGQDNEEIGANPAKYARYFALTRELLRAERRTAVKLRNESRINDEVLRKLEHELDLSRSAAFADVVTQTAAKQDCFRGAVINFNSSSGGAVAQLGARLDGIEEVVGSNPIGSTI